MNLQRINFRIFGGALVFRLWPAVMTAAMLAVLLSLGVWQVERLQWKESLIATMAARMRQKPADVETLGPDIANLEYRHVTASGVYQHDKELYLYALSLGGDSGYHLLTPLQLDDGRYLLVDRGWLPYADKGSRELARPIGPVTVTGTLRLPPKYHLFTPDNRPAQNQWYLVDFSAMAKAAGVPEFLPYTVWLDAPRGKPRSYPIGGQVRINLPNNHFGYAVTWFALAAALLVIFVLNSYKRKA